MKKRVYFQNSIKLNLFAFCEPIDIHSLKHYEVLCYTRTGYVIFQHVDACRLEKEQPNYIFQISKRLVRMEVITLSLWTCKSFKQENIKTLMIQI